MSVVGAVLLGAVIGAALSVTMPVDDSSSPITPLMAAEAAATDTEVDGRQLLRDEHERFKQVIEQADRHVMKITTEACGLSRQGTATLLEQHGDLWLVTNNHVVAGASTVTVELPTGEKFFVDVLGQIAGRDLALLDHEPLSQRVAVDLMFEPVAVGRRVEVGQQIAVVGFPSATFQMQSGWTQSIERRFDNGEAVDVVVVDIPVSGGHSGGLLIGPDGNASGIIAAQDPATGGGVAYHIDDVIKRPLRSLASCP